MNIRELRIGNILTSGEVIRINAEENHVRVRNLVSKDRTHLNPEEAFPEVLTEKWLLKFGYKFAEEYNGYADNHCVRFEGGIYTFIPFCTNDVDCFTIIYCVHQLQNLHFALTGEELIL
jgi:hypothetical protein